MVKAIKFNSLGERLEEIELPASVFDVDVNAPKVLLNEVVTMYLANQRQGSRRTPVRVHGGRAFAILPKDWYRPIPRTKKRMALKVALTDRAREGRIFIVESFNFDKPNTKKALELLGKIAPEKGRKLVVTDGHHVPTVKSFTNLPDVMTDRADGLYAYEVLKSSYIIMTQDSLQHVEEVFSS